MFGVRAGQGGVGWLVVPGDSVSWSFGPLPPDEGYRPVLRDPVAAFSPSLLLTRIGSEMLGSHLWTEIGFGNGHDCPTAGTEYTALTFFSWGGSHSKLVTDSTTMEYGFLGHA